MDRGTGAFPFGLANPIFNKEDTARAPWLESKSVGPDSAAIDQMRPVPQRLRRDALTGKDPNMVWMAGREGMTRDGKIGLAVRGWPLELRLLFIAAFLSFCGAGHAADSVLGTASPAAGGDPASGGAACSAGALVWSPPIATAEDLLWASVWLGHFSGGLRFENGNGQTFIDWRDDILCFPSRQKCQAWIAGLRRAYRRPEGFWTCLLLR